MSKQVLKIERQKWMPKDAQYWCMDEDVSCWGQVAANGCYTITDEWVMSYLSNGSTYKTWMHSLDQLTQQFDYVYEIVDSVKKIKEK